MGWISAFEVNGKIIQIKFGKIKKIENSILLNILAKKIKNFFNKKITKIKIPHKIRGNKIQKKVWNELKKIPYGDTRSYKEVALAIGHPQSARAVANACAKNPYAPIVPCHRVVRSDGNLGGYSAKGGIKKKAELLRIESQNVRKR